MTSRILDLSQLFRRLERLYGSLAEIYLSKIVDLIQKHSADAPAGLGWSQNDVVLITYGDQVQADSEPPLATLHRFLTENHLDPLINTVHLLPFCPYSSDDGFSVIDYRQVDPNLGGWDDIERLGTDCGLMFDLVLNHISSQSDWFQSYLKGEEPYSRFFIECEPDADLSAVIRPRSLPLLTRFQTDRGERFVWTTFSADQIDLNFSNPDVLIEMLDVLLLYASRGARIVRLDAIAYLWKSVGTNCIHLEQTHELVKLMRDVLEATHPNVLILTETNVPHRENVSYFGDGDEAQMVYQFSLPPLLLDAFVNKDPTPLRSWLSQLEPPCPGTTYFNFTASHDGIGVRPLEGLIEPQRLQTLVDHVHRRGGQVSTKANSDGANSPYELNIAYVDAIGEAGLSDESHAHRFLACQAVMLALQGIPGIYFHSLVGSRNDLEGMKESNQPRRINRHKYALPDLQQRLSNDMLQHHIFEGYQELLGLRQQHTAFHPDAQQSVIDSNHPELLAFTRTSVDESDLILCITNFGEAPISIDLTLLSRQAFSKDLISRTATQEGVYSLPPGTTAWLT